MAKYKAIRGFQGRVQVSWILAFAVPISAVLLVGRVIPLDSGTVSAKATLIALGVFYFAGFALQGHYSPRLLTLRFLRDGENGGISLGDTREGACGGGEIDRRATSIGVAGPR